MPLLAYWSYYRVDNVGEVDWDDLSKTDKIKALESEQIHFLKKSVQMLREEGMPPQVRACQYESSY